MLSTKADKSSCAPRPYPYDTTSLYPSLSRSSPSPSPSSPSPSPSRIPPPPPPPTPKYTGPRIMLFCGNPGSGKSTICTAVAEGTHQFKSGGKLGRLTTKIEMAAVGNKTIADTAGLADSEFREEASTELTNLLNAGGHLQLFFVLHWTNRGCSEQDKTTMKLILDAIPNISRSQYSIILNNMTPVALKHLSNKDKMMELITFLDKGLPGTSFVHYIMHNADWAEAENVQMVLDNNTRQFLENAPMISLEPKRVNKIQHQLHDETYKKLKAEIEALKIALEHVSTRTMYIRDTEAKVEKDIIENPNASGGILQNITNWIWAWFS